MLLRELVASLYMMDSQMRPYVLVADQVAGVGSLLGPRGRVEILSTD